MDYQTMPRKRRIGVWVRGHIFEVGHQHQRVRYLIERVVPDSKTWVTVDFRNLENWMLYPDDSRSTNDAGIGCIIRKPTDEEYAMIAKHCLLGGEQR